MKNICSLIIVSLVLCISVTAQTKRRSRAKKATKVVATQTVEPALPTAQIDKTVSPANIPAKKNERHERAANSATIESIDNKSVQNVQSERTTKANVSAEQLPFEYEFAQPKFQITRVIIAHDVAGKGKITFYKQDLGDPLTDPLTISARSLEKIQSLWTAINLIETNETFQSAERNYQHLGTMKLRRWQDDMVREVEFNWTENQIAKGLTGEYKKLTEQYVWIFEMNLARENQPLNAPQLIDRFDSLLKRSQISDPKQMLGYLREVADDERIPLLARNHITKIISRIEKLKEEK